MPYQQKKPRAAPKPLYVLKATLIKATEPLVRFIYGHTSIFLFILLAIILFGVFSYVQNLQNNLVKSSALNKATLYSQAIAEFRTIYTSEVVNTAKEQGIKITHDYKQHEGAVPLPTTLSMMLGESIGKSQEGAKTFLYSPFPFRGGEKEKGMRDKFSHDAWDYLSKNPEKMFYQFEEIDNQPVLRFATADVMRPACIDCHNSHPDSPKSDWKAGDVRGVLEIVQPLENIKALTQERLKYFVILFVSIIFLLLMFVGFAINELRRIKKHVEQTSLAQSSFLANMSHELRTPLNAINGLSEMILEDVKDADSEVFEDFIQPLEQVYREGNHLLELVTNLINASKLEAGETQLEISQIDVSKIVDELYSRGQTLAKVQNNEIIKSVAEDVGTIETDVEKLKDVISSLINNAAKFTENGTITLSVERIRKITMDYIQFNVSDTGIGMTIEQSAKILEAFAITDSSMESHYDGSTGLGLTICYKYTQKLVGNISFVTEIGKGTTFTIEFPAVFKEKK